MNGTATTAGWVTGNRERAPREGRQVNIRFTHRSADAVPEPRRPGRPLKTPFEEGERMLATVWSPTWVIDGRDPARTPQTHERETRWRRRSTAWACWLFPRYGRGGGHGFVPHPGVATHTQPGALGSALNLASPQRPMAAARVLNSQKGGVT